MKAIKWILFSLSLAASLYCLLWAVQTAMLSVPAEQAEHMLAEMKSEYRLGFAATFFLSAMIILLIKR
jgi:hypothetical protein